MASIGERMMRRGGIAAALLAVPITAVTGATAVGAANPAPTLTPLLDCVTYNAQTQVYTAYFGYSNTESIPLFFAVGNDNQFAPGEQNHGQPTTFNVGTYPRVVSAQFDGVALPSVTWELDGNIATATVSSPSCTAGATTPASDVTATSGTLNGVVTPQGTDTTYRFEWGTQPTLGQSTATQDAGAGTLPVVVQQPLPGLMPSTTYYFRLDASNSVTTTEGQTLSFTTSVALLTITTTSLPPATRGSPYSATIEATGGNPPYTFHRVGLLPKGLHWANGVISGTPSHKAMPGSYPLTVVVKDTKSSLGGREVAEQALTLMLG